MDAMDEYVLDKSEDGKSVALNEGKVLGKGVCM